ncbi:NO-inducible flavohemoprotein [Pseudomonas sp. RIT-PI-AD]|uniref:NO-inducible flavohemoprotein n=1 Tax=Pseudomonas sp. RIT-PI-AD TaxID=3035294 RepID=UPI0021DAFD69|nr:NO-inducible flavohemoprotein [Pseudomonas sp. RIT-PI-AD]
MLDPSQRALIKATVPLLESAGEALTTHFYRIMFAEYPQVRPLFNQAHQASGEQPRALAEGVLAYARHIDRLDALGPLVARIVNKHVALQIQPAHYPIVGTCLLQAIREVLGADVTTDAVIDAWAVAYRQLADLLIASEDELYAASAAALGGWRGARRFLLARKVVESEEITSFYWRPEDGGPVAAFIPGQYVGLRLQVEGEEMRRTYSLSALGDGTTYRISVKREPGGKVSNALHERFVEGDGIDLFPPAGEFVLRPGSHPLALISAGVGITPALAMLEAALPSGRAVHFIHCARHGGVHAFRGWLDGVAAAHPQLRRFYCYSEPRDGDQADAQGLLTRERLAAWLPDLRRVEAYFLGPRPFMAQVKRHLRDLGVADDRCHYEFFGPATALE